MKDWLEAHKATRNKFSGWAKGYMDAVTRPKDATGFFLYGPSIDFIDYRVHHIGFYPLRERTSNVIDFLVTQGKLMEFCFLDKHFWKIRDGKSQELSAMLTKEQNRINALFERDFPQEWEEANPVKKLEQIEMFE